VSLMCDVVCAARRRHAFPTRRSSDLTETTGVAAQVQHALARDLLRQPLPVLALVGEEAGLVRAGRIGAELHAVLGDDRGCGRFRDRKSTRLNSSHVKTSYAVFCLKKK